MAERPDECCAMQCVLQEPGEKPCEGKENVSADSGNINAFLENKMTDAGDTLELYRGGYPVHVDMAQARVDGAATGMRFDLPLRGHNLPLRHSIEHKLVVALRGSLQVRHGRHLIASIGEGSALVLAPGTPHRIAQHGPCASTVGVVLWPGRVEQAFREIAAHTSAVGTDLAAMKAILTAYGVEWDSGTTALAPPAPMQAEPLARMLAVLPPAVREAMLAHLPHWLQGG
jgi:hypothetical protein